MKTYKAHTENLKDIINLINCGDEVLLSGTVYTARDAAHKKIMQLIKNSETPPFEIRGASI